MNGTIRKARSARQDLICSQGTSGGSHLTRTLLLHRRLGRALETPVSSLWRWRTRGRTGVQRHSILDKEIIDETDVVGRIVEVHAVLHQVQGDERRCDQVERLGRLVLRVRS